MPLHIDVRVNDSVVRRIHIARMTTSGGMNPDSINEYAVVLGELETIGHKDNGMVIKGFRECPEEWEWDLSEIRFTHRYGDDELTCLMNAIQAVKTHETTAASL